MQEILSKITKYIADKAIILTTFMTEPNSTIKKYEIIIKKEKLEYTLNKISIIQTLLPSIILKYKTKELQNELNLVQIKLDIHIRKLKQQETTTILKLYNI